MKRRFVNWLGRSRLSPLKRVVSSICAASILNTVMPHQKGVGPFCTFSFDCDFPRDIEVLPSLIDLLQKFDIKASFACVGQWIRRFPDAHRQLVDAGHELLNHTETHPNLYHPDYEYARKEELNRKRFNQISREERRLEIERCHQTFLEVLDYSPVGFRTPHFGILHVDDVYSILEKLDYRLSSSVLASACPTGGLPFRRKSGIWEIPLSPCPEHPFGVFDSWHSLSKHGAAHTGNGKLAGLFARLCEQVKEGGYINTYFDPRDVFDSGELKLMLAHSKDRGFLAVTYEDVLEEVEAQGRTGSVHTPTL